MTPAPTGPNGSDQKTWGCTVCGAPVGRAHAWCAACRPEQRRRYMAARGHPERTPVAPIPQDRPDLPPLGVLITDDDGSRVQCHECGNWYVSLASHIRRHGYRDHTAYREQYALAQTLALVAPELSQRLRVASQSRCPPMPFGPDNPPPRRPIGTPHRLSTRLALAQARRRRAAG